MNEPKPLPNPSETKRTDALTERHEREGKDYHYRWHDYARLACQLERELASLADELRLAREDVQRMDWMERYLCRAGEVKNDSGQTVKLARVWSIMGELETLRDTLDAAIEAYRKDAASSGPKD